MKFLVSPSPQALGRARPPIRIFLGFAALVLAGAVAQRAALGQLSPSGVVDFYLPGGEAMPLTALVEELHTAAFLAGFLFLMLGSLLLVTPLPPAVRTTLTLGPAIASAADLAAPFLVTLAGAPGVIRVVSFAAATLLYGGAVAVLAWRFGRPLPASEATHG